MSELFLTEFTSQWFDTYKKYAMVQQEREVHQKDFLQSYKSKSWTVVAVPEISRVVASGPIGVGSAETLRKVLLANPQLHLLELDSPGGLIAEENKLISIVTEHHLDTLVLSECASACTGVFLAGNNRYIGTDSWLGFHQSGYKGRPHDTVWSNTEYMTSLSYYEKDINEKFAKSALNTSYYDIWYPYPIDVKRSGFATAWWSERGAHYR